MDTTETEEELARMVADLTISNDGLRALLRSALREMRRCGEHPRSIVMALEIATDRRRRENRPRVG